MFLLVMYLINTFSGPRDDINMDKKIPCISQERALNKLTIFTELSRLRKGVKWFGWGEDAIVFHFKSKYYICPGGAQITETCVSGNLPNISLALHY
jgi:hypothetical protein